MSLGFNGRLWFVTRNSNEYEVTKSLVPLCLIMMGHLGFLGQTPRARHSLTLA